MLNADLFQSHESNYQRWERHEYINFTSPVDMLKWIKEDAKSLEMSHKIFDSVLYCLENNIDGIVPITLMLKAKIGTGRSKQLPESVKMLAEENDEIYAIAQLDIEVIEPNFQIIIEKYIERLLETENYERISEVLPILGKYGYTVPM